MTWQLLDSILRHYPQFRELYECEGVEEINVAGYLINVHTVLDGIEDLPLRQRQAVVYTCLHDMREIDVAQIMLPGAKSAAPVGSYKRKGLKKLVERFYS